MTQSDLFANVFHKLKSKIDAAPPTQGAAMFLEILRQVDLNSHLALNGDFITILFTDGSTYNHPRQQ